MSRPRRLRLSSSTPAPLVALLVLAGCSHQRSDGFAPAACTSATPAAVSSRAPVATGEEEVRPLVLVHGISGSPADWKRILDGLGRGRTVFPDAYCDDVAALATGSVSRSSVFAIGYYKRRAQDTPYFAGQGSIGGCPVARTDAGASFYPVAYVDLVDRCVEEILRATGAPEVDMVGCSMGGVVSRAYVRWRSGRGPNGASRVRRLLVLESPSRGLNDVEAVMLSFDKMPFQRWGEIAELARAYPAWGGRSYISELNDGWDAWAVSHGVTYGTLYGYGHTPVNAGTLAAAVDTIKSYLAGASSSPAPAPPAPGPGGMPPSMSTVPGLGVSPTSAWTALQQAFIFLDWKRLDLPLDLGEILGGDADGFVRVAASSASAGPEFPHSVFDSRFQGLHMDRGRPDETIQYCRNSRECIRRFCVQGRVPRAQLVSANLSVANGNGAAPWLLLDYEVTGSDGFSVQVITEDATLHQVRQLLPLPDDPTVYGAPLFEGRHRIRLDGEPAGNRVATVIFYDASGTFAQAGPFSLSVPRPTGPSTPRRRRASSAGRPAAAESRSPRTARAPSSRGGSSPARG